MNILFLNSIPSSKQHVIEFSLPFSQRQPVLGKLNGKSYSFIQDMELATDGQGRLFFKRIQTILKRIEALWQQTYDDQIDCAKLTSGGVASTPPLAVTIPLLLSPFSWAWIALGLSISAVSALAGGHFLGPKEAAQAADRAVLPDVRELLETQFEWIEIANPYLDQEINRVDQEFQRVKEADTSLEYLSLKSQKEQLNAIKKYFIELTANKQNILC
ncbi:MAG: hypothetical protein K1X28_06475 [Parachlamydiales bacterium]|nr:hypothetical protein [Parachlamydiales bacterium]